MYLNKKNIKNADLVSAFMQCPFGDTTSNCPFIPYQNLNNPEEQINALNQLPQNELQQLRTFHNKCTTTRITNNRNAPLKILLKNTF